MLLIRMRRLMERFPRLRSRAWPAVWLLRGRRAGLRVRIARGWRAAKKGGSSSSRAVKLLSRLLAAELLCWEGVGLPCS